LEFFITSENSYKTAQYNIVHDRAKASLLF